MMEEKWMQPWIVRQFDRTESQQRIDDTPKINKQSQLLLQYQTVALRTTTKIVE